MSTMTIEQIRASRYEHIPTNWKDEVIDPEGHNSQKATAFTAKRINNVETGVTKAHERLNEFGDYMENTEDLNRQMRFELLLLKASVASGMTSNMLVDNFETLDSVNLIDGFFDAQNKQLVIL